MKRCVVLASLVFLSATHAHESPPAIDDPANKRTVRYATEGEDATSAFYYFFYTLRGHDSVAKVRALWNGGATNAPTITDYYLNGTFIQIIERTAERSALPRLVKGADAPFKNVRDVIIKTTPPESEKLYSFPKVAEIPRGSDAERSEMATLISILASERKPLPK